MAVPPRLIVFQSDVVSLPNMMKMESGEVLEDSYLRLRYKVIG